MHSSSVIEVLSAFPSRCSRYGLRRRDKAHESLICKRCQAIHFKRNTSGSEKVQRGLTWRVCVPFETERHRSFIKTQPCKFGGCTQPTHDSTGTRQHVTRCVMSWEWQHEGRGKGCVWSKNTWSCRHRHSHAGATCQSSRRGEPLLDALSRQRQPLHLPRRRNTHKTNVSVVRTLPTRH